MGLFNTRWEAEYKGHNITVYRNEFTRGIRMECDGRVVAKRNVTLIGIGKLSGAMKVEGRKIPLEAQLSFWSRCNLKVDGRKIAARNVE